MNTFFAESGLRIALLRQVCAIPFVLPLSALIAWGQSESTQPPLPPPGHLMDIGGWRLHINCTGDSPATQPTVILESGLGDFSVEWSLVQPGVAKFARVCSYDRAGDGWSDLGPYPRTLRQIVYELHKLVEKANVKPPFVLVAHSYGGWLVRLYNSTYPGEAVGMVLVEPGADDPRRLLPDGKVVHSSDLATDRPIPSVKIANPLRIGDIPPAALEQMRAAARESAKDPNPGARDKLPLDAKRMRAWALGQVGHLAAAVNPFEAEELAEMAAERRHNEYPLGDIPLLVLTRGIAEEDGADADALEAKHRRDHEVISTSSRHGKLVIATHSGHHVQLDEPELVIQSIHEVLTAAATSK